MRNQKEPYSLRTHSSGCLTVGRMAAILKCSLILHLKPEVLVLKSWWKGETAVSNRQTSSTNGRLSRHTSEFVIMNLYKTNYTLVLFSS